MKKSNLMLIITVIFGCNNENHENSTYRSISNSNVLIQEVNSDNVPNEIKDLIGSSNNKNLNGTLSWNIEITDPIIDISFPWENTTSNIQVKLLFVEDRWFDFVDGSGRSQYGKYINIQIKTPNNELDELFHGNIFFDKSSNVRVESSFGLNDIIGKLKNMTISPNIEKTTFSLSMITNNENLSGSMIINLPIVQEDRVVKLSKATLLIIPETGSSHY
ncbi:hypothetical protein KKF91_22460 [Myxococcota bacterium]|nr:hypothetical protein [Myxococcota bacterium]MBU1433304.1 hypothetical protein [Myxococcota bacterium]